MARLSVMPDACAPDCNTPYTKQEFACVYRKSGDDFGFRRKNSLLLNENTLFLRNNSLFCCVGNLLQAAEFARVAASKIHQGENLAKFPVLFPVSRELRRGDGFDYDCVRHHAVIRNVEIPVGCPKARHWRALQWRSVSAETDLG